jgi:hypothetical protein
MRFLARVVAAASLLLACSGKTDLTVGPGASDDGGGSAIPPACPLVRPVSEAVAVSAQQDCEARSLGRWALCHAERDYTGTGDLPSMWNGADGVEYTEENGAWRFYYLRKQPDGSLARIPGLAYDGAVEFMAVIQGGQCDVVLRAEDGKSDAYNRFQFWDSPPAYRNFVYDIYDFVRVE